MKKIKHNKAFTLLELLVVIGILSILSALLLSLVTKGRDSASRTTNIYNLKSLGYAIQMYATDNDGYLPYISEEITDSRCLFLLLPYIDYQLEVFYPPSVFSDRVQLAGFNVLKNNPQSLINGILAGEDSLIYYPGYAYSSVNSEGDPILLSETSGIPIVCNFNATFPDQVYYLTGSGAVLSNKGDVAK